MARQLFDATLECLDCSGFNRQGKVVVFGKKYPSLVTTEGLLEDGITHGKETRHTRYNLTLLGNTYPTMLDGAGGTMPSLPDPELFLPRDSS